MGFGLIAAAFLSRCVAAMSYGVSATGGRRESTLCASIRLGEARQAWEGRSSACYIVIR